MNNNNNNNNIPSLFISYDNPTLQLNYIKSLIDKELCDSQINNDINKHTYNILLYGCFGIESNDTQCYISNSLHISCLHSLYILYIKKKVSYSKLFKDICDRFPYFHTYLSYRWFWHFIVAISLNESILLHSQHPFVILSKLNKDSIDDAIQVIRQILIDKDIINFSSDYIGYDNNYQTVKYDESICLNYFKEYIWTVFSKMEYMNYQSTMFNILCDYNNNDSNDSMIKILICICKLKFTISKCLLSIKPKVKLHMINLEDYLYKTTKYITKYSSIQDSKLFYQLLLEILVNADSLSSQYQRIWYCIEELIQYNNNLYKNYDSFYIFAYSLYKSTRNDSFSNVTKCLKLINKLIGNFPLLCNENQSVCAFLKMCLLPLCSSVNKQIKELALQCFLCLKSKNNNDIDNNNKNSNHKQGFENRLDLSSMPVIIYLEQSLETIFNNDVKVIDYTSYFNSDSKLKDVLYIYMSTLLFHNDPNIINISLNYTQQLVSMFPYLISNQLSLFLYLIANSNNMDKSNIINMFYTIPKLSNAKFCTTSIVSYFISLTKSVYPRLQALAIRCLFDICKEQPRVINQLNDVITKVHLSSDLDIKYAVMTVIREFCSEMPEQGKELFLDIATACVTNQQGDDETGVIVLYLEMIKLLYEGGELYAENACTLAKNILGRKQTVSILPHIAYITLLDSIISNINIEISQETCLELFQTIWHYFYDITYNELNQTAGKCIATIISKRIKNIDDPVYKVLQERKVQLLDLLENNNQYASSVEIILSALIEHELLYRNMELQSSRTTPKQNVKQIQELCNSFQKTIINQYKNAPTPTKQEQYSLAMLLCFDHNDVKEDLHGNSNKLYESILRKLLKTVTLELSSSKWFDRILFYDGWKSFIYRAYNYTYKTMNLSNPSNDNITANSVITRFQTIIKPFVPLFNNKSNNKSSTGYKANQLSFFQSENASSKLQANAVLAWSYLLCCSTTAIIHNKDNTKNETCDLYMKSLKNLENNNMNALVAHNTCISIGILAGSMNMNNDRKQLALSILMDVCFNSRKMLKDDPYFYGNVLAGTCIGLGQMLAMNNDMPTNDFHGVIISKLIDEICHILKFSFDNTSTNIKEIRKEFNNIFHVNSKLDPPKLLKTSYDKQNECIIENTFYSICWGLSLCIVKIEQHQTSLQHIYKFIMNIWEQCNSNNLIPIFVQNGLSIILMNLYPLLLKLDIASLDELKLYMKQLIQLKTQISIIVLSYITRILVSNGNFALIDFTLSNLKLISNLDDNAIGIGVLLGGIDMNENYEQQFLSPFETTATFYQHEYGRYALNLLKEKIMFDNSSVDSMGLDVIDTSNAWLHNAGLITSLKFKQEQFQSNLLSTEAELMRKPPIGTIARVLVDKVEQNKQIDSKNTFLKRVLNIFSSQSILDLCMLKHLQPFSGFSLIQIWQETSSEHEDLRYHILIQILKRAKCIYEYSISQRNRQQNITEYQDESSLHLLHSLLSISRFQSLNIQLQCLLLDNLYVMLHILPYDIMKKWLITCVIPCLLCNILIIKKSVFIGLKACVQLSNFEKYETLTQNLIEELLFKQVLFIMIKYDENTTLINEFYDCIALLFKNSDKQRKLITKYLSLSIKRQTESSERKTNNDGTYISSAKYVPSLDMNEHVWPEHIHNDDDENSNETIGTSTIIANILKEQSRQEKELCIINVRCMLFEKRIISDSLLQPCLMILCGPTSEYDSQIAIKILNKLIDVLSYGNNILSNKRKVYWIEQILDLMAIATTNEQMKLGWQLLGGITCFWCGIVPLSIDDWDYLKYIIPLTISRLSCFDSMNCDNIIIRLLRLIRNVQHNRVSHDTITIALLSMKELWLSGYSIPTLIVNDEKVSSLLPDIDAAFNILLDYIKKSL